MPLSFRGASRSGKRIFGIPRGRVLVLGIAIALAAVLGGLPVAEMPWMPGDAGWPKSRWLGLFATSAGTADEYTIGLDPNPPFQYWSETGKASGAMPELLEVAARRAGIRLRWVPFEGTPEKALRGGSGIDLWPLVQIRGTPRTFHTTQAFARAETLLVRLAGQRGAPLGRLGVGYRAVAQQWARQSYPNAIHERPEDASGIQSLCEGTLDATLAESPAFDAMLLDRPKACAGEGFDVRVIPELKTDYAIGASYAAAETADLLRHQLGEMAREGVLDEIFQSYYPLSHYRGAETFAETQTERARRMVRWGVGGLAALCGVLWIGLRRSRRKTAAAMEMAEMRARFLTSISHELRTPLNGVLGLASVLDSTALDRTQKEYVGLIRSSGEILLRTVNEVLDFSKLEAGKQTAAHEPVALEGLLESVMSVLAPVAHQKALDLEWAVDAAVPTTMLSDENALRQTMMNLVGNAIKFTGEGRVTVTAGMDAVGAESRVLRIAVSDSGPGIAAGQEEAVFNPFVRGSDPRTQAIVGTGLGLSITKRLVLLLGGSVHVRNNPERGCTFEVLLPLTAAEVPADTLPNGWTDCGFRKRALLATERRMPLDMLGRRLREAGGEAIWASNESELREAMAGGESWDLIVLDESLCEDPERLAEELRQQHGARGAAMVLMTSAAVPPTPTGGGGAGTEGPAAGVGWYRKPFLSELFCSFLEKLDGGAGGRGEARTVGEASHGTGDTSLPREEMGAVVAGIGSDVVPTRSGHAHTGSGLVQLRRATRPCAGAPAHCEECVRETAGALVDCLAAFHPGTERPVALVADDNPVNRKVLVSLLRTLGVGCDTAASGDEALRLFEGSPYAWVVMDWHMPGVDGMEALRQMRAQEAQAGRRPTPLILCTASSENDPELLERCAELDGVLPKPITLRSLQQVLEGSARRRWTGSPSAQKPALGRAPRALSFPAEAGIPAASRRAD